MFNSHTKSPTARESTILYTKLQTGSVRRATMFGLMSEIVEISTPVIVVGQVELLVKIRCGRVWGVQKCGRARLSTFALHDFWKNVIRGHFMGIETDFPTPSARPPLLSCRRPEYDAETAKWTC